MYLEGVSSSTRDVVENEAETSIIDGTTFPYENWFGNQSSFSFSDQWMRNTGLSGDYGKIFFETIPEEQDMFLTLDFSLDAGLPNSYHVVTKVSICERDELIENALLYQNQSPSVEDNLLHKKASISIPALIDMGVIVDANTSEDLCFITTGSRLEDYEMCSREIAWHFNEVRINGEEIIQVITDLKSKGINFDYRN